MSRKPKHNLCRTEVGPERALRSREMLHLFFNMIPEHFEDVKKKIGLNEQAEERAIRENKKGGMNQGGKESDIKTQKGSDALSIGK